VPLRHAVLLAIAVVATGFAAIFIRLAVAPSLSIAFYRNAIAAAILLPAALVRHPGEFRGLTRRQWATGLLSGALLAVHFAAWISSLALTTVAASVVLVTTGPIFTAAGGRVFFGERAGRSTMAGIFVALAGTALVSGGDLAISGRAAIGDLEALVGAGAAAGYLLAGRRLRQDVSLLSYVALVYATCALLLWPAALLTGSRLTGFSAKVWWLFVLMALVPQMLGHTVFNYLLRDVAATVVAISVMGEPVGSALLALAFFGEVPPWTAVVGGGMILAGIYVALTAQARDRRRDLQPIMPLE
jgi:drug/metabolite transporter (DMT)-like permease